MSQKFRHKFEIFMLCKEQKSISSLWYFHKESFRVILLPILETHVREFHRCPLSDWLLARLITLIFRGLSRFLCSRKCGSKRCSAEKSTWDHLRVQKMTTNVHSEFPDTILNFVCQLGSKDKFFHCRQKRPIP